MNTKAITLTIAASVGTLFACGSGATNPDGNEECLDCADRADAGVQVREITVTNLGDGDGTVEVNGTACEELPCTRSVELGSVVTLEAQPALSSSFQGWTGDCALQREAESATRCEFVVDDDTQVELVLGKSGTLLSQQAFSGVVIAQAGVEDAQGNIYVSGQYRYGLPFSSTIQPVDTAAYVVKWNSEGERLWAHTINRSDLRFERLAQDGLTLGPDGEVYVLGTGLVSGSSTNDSRTFVRRIDPDTGEAAWTRFIAERATNSSMHPVAILLDETGKIFVTGNARGTVGISVSLQTITGGRDSIYLATFESDGSPTSFEGHHSPNGTLQQARMVAIPGGGVAMLAVEDNTNTQFLKFDGNGELTLRKRLEGPAVQVSALGITPDGNLSLAGRAQHGIALGDAPELQMGVSEDHTDSRSWLGQMTLDGTPLWVQRLGVSSYIASVMKFDSAGSLLMTAMINPGDIDFGGGNHTVEDDGMAIVSYTSAGEYRWGQIFHAEGDGRVQPLDVSLRESGDVVLFGGFTRNVTTELGQMTQSYHPDNDQSITGGFSKHNSPMHLVFSN